MDLPNAQDIRNLADLARFTIGRAVPDGKGDRSLGDALLQGVQEPTAVIEQALETASLMLGGQTARDYCLEMICADFLAGANLDASGSSDSLLLALGRLYTLLPNALRREFLQRIPQAS